MIIDGREEYYFTKLLVASVSDTHLMMINHVELHMFFIAEQELGFIKEAQNLIASRSDGCVTFKEQTDGQADYMEIVKASSGCGSNVGRQGGVQYLRLGEECFATGFGVIAHEMMHVLGFFHEHVREDRNNYITVHDELIAPGMTNSTTKR